TDIRTMKIPNRLNAAVFFTGAASIFLMHGPSLAERIAGVFVISVPMLLLTCFVPGGFGAGDIKLMAASGLFMGIEGNITATMIGFFLGGVWGLVLLLGKKAGRKDVFAFGPCLCAGLALSFVILCMNGSYSIL
ncbi:MAG: A24 family peptidase, partial [Clostridiales bacterium]|nr:A24 family peptidase [Clostridiales bacterium]